MILVLFSCLWSPKPDLEIDADGLTYGKEHVAFPFYPTKTKIVYPPDMRPVQNLPFRLADDMSKEGKDEYWLDIDSDTHVGWLYQLFFKVNRVTHRDSVDGPVLQVTSPYFEYPSFDWSCWLVVIGMETGMPQIVPATAPGRLIRWSRPRRLGVDGQCVHLTPAELPGLLERIPNRCEEVVLEADDLTWKDAKPWFDASPTARLMYPTMRTIWRLRKEAKERGDPYFHTLPIYLESDYDEWKCENRLDIEDLKDPGFSNKDPEVTPNWSRVWHRKPAEKVKKAESPAKTPAQSP